MTVCHSFWCLIFFPLISFHWGYLLYQYLKVGNILHSSPKAILTHIFQKLAEVISDSVYSSPAPLDIRSDTKPLLQGKNMTHLKWFMDEYNLFQWHSEPCPSDYQMVTKTESKTFSIRTYMPPFSSELEKTFCGSFYKQRFYWLSCDVASHNTIKVSEEDQYIQMYCRPKSNQNSLLKKTKKHYQQLEGFFGVFWGDGVGVGSYLMHQIVYSILTC